MEFLPEEILVKIISHLNFMELTSVICVNSKFKRLATDAIEKRCISLKWRLDLFLPPGEIMEGILILDYNRRKRKYLKEHPYRKHRKLSLISKGISISILQNYPTINLELPSWNYNYQTQMGVVDMMW